MEVFIRSSHAKKAINYEFRFFSDPKKKAQLRLVSFSIDPNWQIKDFFEHWEGPNEGNYECKRVTSPETKCLKEIKQIQEELLREKSHSYNEKIVSSDWLLIYSMQCSSILDI